MAGAAQAKQPIAPPPGAPGQLQPHPHADPRQRHLPEPRHERPQAQDAEERRHQDEQADEPHARPFPYRPPRGRGGREVEAGRGGAAGAALEEPPNTRPKKLLTPLATLATASRAFSPATCTIVLALAA